MTDEKLQELKNLFYNDKFATEAAGIELIDAGEGNARCEMEIKPIHLNAAGTVMGGATFTLADFT
ncbi:MAG: PaaI family thioesterase, partial [Clostridia bacterium]|nr:PaaI family thioesterase [Clostridia bacterium]